MAVAVRSAPAGRNASAPGDRAVTAVLGTATVTAVLGTATVTAVLGTATAFAAAAIPWQPPFR
ncbi:hypothetical protein, partial [Streptomyces hygroscopicus]|uniref:hypothetical protein n=1 Tax=Streptomyces hygroscopicus TaxID=1912 RepID=UPI0036AF7A3E